MKSGLGEFDEAFEDFQEAAPQDPRRWQAKLFMAQQSDAREVAGLPPGPSMSETIDEILAAPDADPAAKSEASIMKLIIGIDMVEDGQMSVDDWNKSADAHIAAYPDAPMNSMIQAKKASLQAVADLKTKPLDLKFTALDGKEIDLINLRGKVVLLDFWATWCGPCGHEVPNVVKAYEALHSKGFEIVGISLDEDRAKLESFIKENGMAWPQYFDGKGWQNEISSRYGIQSIPAMWLINKQGMLVSTNARENLEAVVEKLLAE